MKNHEIKPEKLYTTMPDEPKPVYPMISIPSEVFEGHQCQIGEKYRVEVLVEIKSMDEYSYGCNMIESEIESDEEEAKEGEKY